MTSTEHEALMRRVEKLTPGDMIFVVPEPGFERVMDPDVRGGSSADAAVPMTGKYVKHSTYWHRRFRDQELTLGTPPAEAVIVEKAAPAKNALRAKDGDQ